MTPLTLPLFDGTHGHGLAAALPFADHLPGGTLGWFVLLLIWLVVGNGAIASVLGIARSRARNTGNTLDDTLTSALSWPLLITWTLAGVYLFVDGAPTIRDPWEERLIFVLLIFFAITVAHTAVRLAVVFLQNRSRRHPSFRALEGLLQFLLRLGFYSVALLLVLDHAGVEITPLLGALGIGGLAVALALQDTLANFFAGLYLTIDRPLNEGDYLEIDGGTFGTIKAYVVGVGWRSVRLRELSNNIFVIPNSRLATGIIKNYDLPQSEMSIVLQCSVAYGSDLDEVERVVVEVAREAQRTLPGAVRTHDPFVRYHTFGDNGIGFSIILRVETFVDQYLLTHEFMKALHRRFDEEGIVIPFPQRRLHLGPSAVAAAEAMVPPGGGADAAAGEREG